MRWRGRHGLVIAITILALTCWAGFGPADVAPVAWQAPSAPGYQGAHQRNDRLAGLERIDLAGEHGPEHVAWGPDGKLYVAVAGGRILRWRADGTQREVFVDTGGRVLGFDFDAAGRLIAADAMRGLLAIDPDGKIEMLADRADDGSPIAYADAVVVARDGLIYLSDASQRFAPKHWGGTFVASVYDILEQSASGRILVFDPHQRSTRVVAHGLSFANGVALSADQRHLWVNETGRYRVWKIEVAARDLNLLQGATPQAGIAIDNLPGFPDNLMRGEGGRMWLGLAKPRGALLDHLAPWPVLRRIVSRLPRAWWPVPPAYGHVIAFDESGRVVADLQDPSGGYPETTGVTERDGVCHVQSLHASYLGWFRCAERLGRS